MGIHIMLPLYKMVIPPPIIEPFYPEPHPEITSIDGSVSQRYVGPGEGVDWATIIAEAGNLPEGHLTSIYAPNIKADSVTDRWLINAKGIFLFNTSRLEDAGTILSAIFSLYCWYKLDQFTIPLAIDVNVYSSNPAENFNVVGADYATLGSIPFCDTPIAFDDWVVGAYNDFVLNAAGLAAISKTGITKLGTRNANYDVAGVEPNWESLKTAQIISWASERGDGYKPKLVVTCRL